VITGSAPEVLQRLSHSIPIRQVPANGTPTLHLGRVAYASGDSGRPPVRGSVDSSGERNTV